MSDFTIRGLDHVTITAPEELETDVLEFYGTFLGLRRLDKPEGGTGSPGTWFAVGDVQLHVARDSHNPPPTAHFAVTVGDFDVAVERLRDSGYHIEQAHPVPGRRRLYTRDPAGNRIEIVSFDKR
jgi:catechol 2,3-dioxygenase-like lactoylglutathione lyase family enzyme